jgi:ABC-2 type transport system permease protein
LFALIGPRRTRAVAQVLAAIIGAAFFLASQAQTLLGAKGGSMVVRVVSAAAAHPNLRLPPLADWPLRAMLGDPVPLAAMLTVGLAVFLGVAAWLSRRFADNATAAQGSDAGQGRAGATLATFAGGAFAATYRKEFRVLRRDIALLAQVLLRTLYLLPATFLVLRNAGHHVSLALPGGAAVIAFLAGQVASSLTWITVSAEEAPELIACAPAAAGQVRGAKLLAGLTPLIAMLAIPLAVLIWLSPVAGLAATAGSAASAIAAGLINAWRPSPGKRSEFRRRRTGSLLTGVALLLVTLMIAGATGLAAVASPFALIPAALAALGLLALRRSPAQIADALAAKA